MCGPATVSPKSRWCAAKVWYRRLDTKIALLTLRHIFSDTFTKSPIQQNDIL